MQLQVRFFASLVETVGRNELTLEVARGDTVADLWARLSQRYPELGRLSYRPLVACDLTYAEWTDPLQDVGEVAFLPPVSGG
jgi:molybdopterin converting factor subunit 1